MIEPWQRNIVAIAKGIKLKASGNMRWTAHVTVFGVHPRETNTFNIIGFPADSEADAAQSAAEMTAKRIYGDEGTRGFLNTGPAPLYRSTIGYYDGGVTRGRSIEMLILKYTHPVTGK